MSHIFLPGCIEGGVSMLTSVEKETKSKPRNIHQATNYRKESVQNYASRLGNKYSVSPENIIWTSCPVIDDKSAAYKQEGYHFPIYNSIRNIMVCNHLLANSQMSGGSETVSKCSVMLLENAAIFKAVFIRLDNNSAMPKMHLDYTT